MNTLHVSRTKTVFQCPSRNKRTSSVSNTFATLGTAERSTREREHSGLARDGQIASISCKKKEERETMEIVTDIQTGVQFILGFAWT